MKRSRLIIIVFGAILIGGLAVYVRRQLAQPREPVYQGKPLSVWLQGYSIWGLLDGPQAPQPPDEAIRGIGTNAIPFLLRRLEARDSALTTKLLGFARKQHWFRVTYVTTDRRIIQARQAFRALGTSGLFDKLFNVVVFRFPRGMLVLEGQRRAVYEETSTPFD